MVNLRPVDHARKKRALAFLWQQKRRKLTEPRMNVVGGDRCRDAVKIGFGQAQPPKNRHRKYARLEILHLFIGVHTGGKGSIPYNNH